MNNTNVRLGLRENAGQFIILVLINGFVGGMIGLERSILPELAEKEFGLMSASAMLSFIIAFGVTKSLCNYFAGVLANRIGRKRLLVLGWFFALPVPLLLIFAPSWNWVIVANVLLGFNQGFSWSAAVMMKIDLVGEKDRGLAIGINEFTGYLAVGLVAFLSAWIASHYGVRPYPFYLGIGFAIIGLFLSIFLLKDTQQHVSKEQQNSDQPTLKSIFWDTTLRHPSLGAISQAGLVNNLNDGMVWGIWPLLLASKGFNLSQIGLLCAIYPVSWSFSQLITGRLSDVYSKKSLLFWGMLLQGLAIISSIWAQNFYTFAGIGLALGWGTAMVYPTFLNAIANFTPPQQRAESLGVFRMWRDLGYALGALLTGFFIDCWGLFSSIALVGGLTILSAVFILCRYIQKQP
jgi:MFS family permease